MAERDRSLFFEGWRGVSGARGWWDGRDRSLFLGNIVEGVYAPWRPSMEDKIG